MTSRADIKEGWAESCSVCPTDWGRAAECKPV